METGKRERRIGTDWDLLFGKRHSHPLHSSHSKTTTTTTTTTRIASLIIIKSRRRRRRRRRRKRKGKRYENSWINPPFVVVVVVVVGEQMSPVPFFFGCSFILLQWMTDSAVKKRISWMTMAQGRACPSSSLSPSSPSSYFYTVDFLSIIYSQLTWRGPVHVLCSFCCRCCCCCSRNNSRPPPPFIRPFIIIHRRTSSSSSSSYSLDKST